MSGPWGCVSAAPVHCNSRSRTASYHRTLDVLSFKLTWTADHGHPALTLQHTLASLACMPRTQAAVCGDAVWPVTHGMLSSEYCGGGTCAPTSSAVG